MKIIKRTLAVILSLIVAVSCLGINVFAAGTIKSVRIVKLPAKTTFYKGADWDYGYWKFPEDEGTGTFVSRANNICFMYNGGKFSIYQDIGMVDMNGLVVEVTYSDGTKKNIEYKETVVKNNVTPNIYASMSKSLHVGVNTIDVFFMDNPYAYDSYDITLTESAALRGDINGDKKVNSADALLVLQYSVGSASLTNAQKTAADINKDSRINSADALVILRIAVGIEK